MGHSLKEVGRYPESYKDRGKLEERGLFFWWPSRYRADAATNNPLLSALSSGKESSFLGGSGRDSRQACLPTWDQALTTLPVSKAKSSLRTGNHRSGSGISAVNFPRVKCSFQRESSEALAHRTVPVPGGEAEGKDRNWPRGIWTH